MLVKCHVGFIVGKRTIKGVVRFTYLRHCGEHARENIISLCRWNFNTKPFPMHKTKVTIHDFPLTRTITIFNVV